jgi:diguanylate cyclase (GGDEF)-like protein
VGSTKTIHSPHPALPAFDDVPLQRLVKGIARVACALQGFGFIHHLAYGNTMLALVCLIALFPTFILALPSCPLPSKQRPLILSTTLIAVTCALLIVKGDGAQGNSIIALPAVLLIAGLTVSRFHYTILVVATLLLLLAIGAASPANSWFDLFNTIVILAACAVTMRLVAGTLLKTLHSQHWETLINTQIGLPNRLGLERTASDFLLDKAGNVGSVVALSIKRLENLDSTFGHAFGDQALRHAAGIIGKHMSADCIAGRWGGNTFLLLVRHPEHANLPEILARSTQEALRIPQNIFGVDIILDACCGLCTGTDKPLPAADRIERALIAMDEARRIGCDAVVEYREAFSQRIAQEFRYEDALRRTIDSDQVGMAYQPIFHAETNQVIAFEALLRLTDTEGEPVPSLEAIQLAETSGLIHRLGQTILRAVFTDIRVWRQAGAKLLPISVNFSALQLAEVHTAEALSATLAEYGLAPQSIIIEVTETAATSNDSALAQSLAALSALGVPLAIDDFGAGYSSIARLLQTPAELIKFDSTLIQGTDQSSESREFLRRTVHLANSTNARVLIEGIETEAQAKLVRELGCFAAQGYWYAPPMPADAVPGFLAARETAGFRATRSSHPTEPDPRSVTTALPTLS